MSANIWMFFLGLSVAITWTQPVYGAGDSTLLARIEELEKREERNERINQQQQHQIDRLTKQLEEKINCQAGIGPQQRQIQNESPVAFYGKVTNIQTINNKIIQFNQIITNIGNAYQRNTGELIAPVPGIYVFSVTAMAEQHTDAHLGIFVNGVRMTNLKLNGPEHMYDTMSQTAVYYLHMNDRVTVEHWEGNKTIHGDYTTFTAFLLQQEYGSIIVG